MLDAEQTHLLFVRPASEHFLGVIDAVGEDAYRHLLIAQEHQRNGVEQPLEELDVLIRRNDENVDTHEALARVGGRE